MAALLDIRMIRFGSVCSGIEAASVAWLPLGWECAFVSEIEPFACAVLAHRHPDVPNLGDMTKLVDEGKLNGTAIDILVGGTPCQSFSIAGLRKGLDDDRGNLAFEFLRIAREARPRWLVWENVPGVLSSLSHPSPDPRPPEIDLDSGDGPEDGEEVVVDDSYEAIESRDFGCFLAALSELGYGFAWRVLDAEYVRTRRHPRAVPQRRRRVFVIGYTSRSGRPDWRPPAAVLFDPESMSGHPPPRRKAGKATAGLTANGAGASGADDNQAQAGHLVADVSPAVTSKWSKGTGGPAGDECQNLVCSEAAPPLTGNSYGDHKSREGLLIPFDTTQITHKANYSNPKSGDPRHPLASSAHPPAIAFQSKASHTNSMNPSDVAPALDVGKGDGIAIGIHANASEPIIGEGVMPTADTKARDLAVAVSLRGREGGSTAELSEGVSPAIRASQGGGDKQHVMIPAQPVAGTLDANLGTGGACPERAESHVPHSDRTLFGNVMTVRRITPTEAERLQGFEDSYTLAPYRGKPAADGPRYRALGNSMAVNVMTWIGVRIQMMEEILREGIE